jgi:hypothetical protein
MKTCRECGCEWRENADGTLSLADPEQEPCPACDNAPHPMYYEDTTEPRDAHPR